MKDQRKNKGKDGKRCNYLVTNKINRKETTLQQGRFRNGNTGFFYIRFYLEIKGSYV